MSFKKAGVMGWPIAHSLSPRLHTYWLEKYNIAGSYEALPVEPHNLVEAFKDLKAKEFVGVNLTVPHKELALPIMNVLEPLAKHIGAVNTVLMQEDGTLEGRNTDCEGFAVNLLSGGYVADERPVVILGAGGAARGAIVALLERLDAKTIRIANRTFEKAQKLADEFGDSLKPFTWNDPLLMRDAGLLINATSLGMRGQSNLQTDLDRLPRDAVVIDMVYTPLMTGLLKQAQQRGNKIIDGLGMLLYQARPAFQAFFGPLPEVTPELRAYMLEGMI